MLNRRSRVSVALVGALIGCLLGFGFSAALATVWSDTKNFTSNSVSYQNASWGDNGPYVGTVLDRLDHGNADPGKMGARTRVFWAEGVVCEASIYRYNTQSTTHLGVSSDHNCGGWIFSRGRTQTWNGNGYDVKDTMRTVNWNG